MNQDELMHFGVKGMKWGVRRYQNKDGTLTAKGKAKYGNDISQRKPKHVKKQVQDAYASNRLKKKSIKDEVEEKMDKTKEKKRFIKINNDLDKLFDEADKLYETDGPNAWAKPSYDIEKEYDKAFTAYENKRNKVIEEVIDEYASVTLKSLGYKDIEKGREWLKNNNFIDW